MRRAGLAAGGAPNARGCRRSVSAGRRRLGWLLALLVCGCAGGNAPPARCDRQVDSDPEVRRLRMLASGSPYLQAENQHVLATAVRQARLKCLQAEGLAPPGGVEPVKPAETGF